MNFRGTPFVCLLLGLLSVTWQLHAQTWTQYGPQPRFAHTGVYDLTTNQTIVFGGQDPATNTDLNDLWLVSTGTDKHITDTSMTANGTLPSPRYGHVAIYDPNSNNMTIFGGGTGTPGPCVNDTWLLEGANGTDGSPTWVEMSPPGTLPTERIHAAAVYDPNTNSMIVFGGNNCSKSYFNDVWVLSNANGVGGTPAWTELAPSGTLPTTRESCSAVYDSVNNVLIIYGGDAGGTPLGDVWTLSNANGTGGTPQWTELSPTGTAPMARTGVQGIYDSVNNRMTVFGGFYKSVTLTDTWVLTFANGIGGTPAWVQIKPTGTAPSLGYYSAVYDSSADIMIVFAGSSSATKLSGDDHAFTLSYANGLGGTSAWTRGGPATRYAQAMFYDSVSNGMFVFGGQHALTNTNFNDYWELNNAIGSTDIQWTSVTVGGTHPASRGGHFAAYDSNSNRMMLFGGEEGFPTPCVNDYWIMTGANNLGTKPTWLKKTISGTLPGVRAHHAGAYDPTTNSLIVFGGFDCENNTYYNDVWVLSNANAVSGTLAWTQLSATGTPPSPRESMSAIYNSSTNTLTIFGGDAGSTPFSDLWVLSNANGTGGTPAWTQIVTSGGPSARSGHVATYDSANNIMTLQGGWNGTSLLSDSWTLSNANGQGGTPAWTQIGPLTNAPARRFHTAIYAPSSNQINIFGGVDSLSPFEPDDHTFSLTDGNGQP